ncbi:MAG: hypothetical protein ACREBW_04530, partial [Candidatus Micrarchaeaceae archaeon]
RGAQAIRPLTHGECKGSQLRFFNFSSGGACAGRPGVLLRSGSWYLDSWRPARCEVNTIEQYPDT